MPLDPELRDLVPIFVEEVQDRLESLATLAPQAAEVPEAMDQVKRELHTVKGAARMLQVGPVAELCHAAEEVVAALPPNLGSLLIRTVDRLQAMVELVESGEMPGSDRELLDLLGRAAEGPDGEVSAHGDTAAGAGPGGAEAAATAADAAADDAAANEDVAPADAAGGGPEAGGTDEAGPVTVGGADVLADKVLANAGLTDAALTDAALSDAMAEALAAAGADGPALPAAVSAAGKGERAPVGGSDVRVDAGALDAVADQATQVRILALASRNSIERIYDLAKLAEDGLREPQPTQVLAVLATMLRRLAVDVENGQRRLLRSSEDGLERLLSLQLQPLRGYMVHLARYARDLARSLGREVEVELEGEDTRLDRRIARELDESLLHLVRNAVDHGIEDPAQRKAAGKGPVGRLRLAAEASGGRVRLTIADDGAGIDRQAVVTQAVRAGLVDAAAADSLTREEAYRLLFAPGFSTRRRVSEVSGRGVGLDVVAAAVTRVGGEVFLSAEAGQGTTVIVEVPLARRGEQVFLVRVGKARLALPSGPIRQAQRIDASTVLERDGRSFVQLGGRLIPFVPLAPLFGQVGSDQPMLLRGRISGQSLAVTVDEVEGEEEVLVRPVTRTVEVEPAVDGVALLATGQPVGVLSPVVLAKRSYLRQTAPARPIEAAEDQVRVLLVDDSLVTREMERRLLEDAGFLVITAGDAEEGLNFLGEEPFDCLVTDIEMPGMDGFQLTRHLRSIPQFSQLPIIVVSTRDRPEDRLNGLQAGADAYLTKQSLDAGELVDLVRRLSGNR